jgi:hypothetical protein
MNSPSWEWCGHEMLSRPALQSATKTADKNNGGQALHKDGGQALDLLTITLKTDSLNNGVIRGLKTSPRDRIDSVIVTIQSSGLECELTH